jgi:type IV pilus assembly protein PilV
MNINNINHILYDKGFTLVEVLIALTILSIGILAITNMNMTSYRVYFASNKLTTATLISKSLLEELMS